MTLVLRALITRCSAWQKLLNIVKTLLSPRAVRARRTTSSANSKITSWTDNKHTSYLENPLDSYYSALCIAQ